MRKSITIALAYVGLLVGAGFASGQEVIQYFSAYGTKGIIGAMLACVLIVISGTVLFQLGSYFLADNHSVVFDNVTHPNVSKFLDLSTMITLFSIGFVMIAGAGSNLQQQFGLSNWIGALIMTALLVISGFLDVDKITNIISAITPLLIISVLGAAVVTILRLPELDTEHLNEIAMSNQAASGVFGSWWVSALNYAGLCIIVGVSMILVIAGSQMNPRHAGAGGLVGGMLFAALLILLTLILFFNMEDIVGADMPLLMVFDNMHPAVGVVVALIIYAMIYNTAVGMFYAMSRRLSTGHPERFLPIYLTVVGIGFLLSFVGFSDLVSWIYPILGYLGVVLVAVLTASWVKSRDDIAVETERRVRLAELAETQLDPESSDLSRRERKEVEVLVGESHVEDAELWQSVQEEVASDLDADPFSEFELADYPQFDPDHEEYSGPPEGDTEEIDWQAYDEYYNPGSAGESNSKR
ncbi:hypothetical protein QP027_04565 [Corynebacterium breve]|uniref:Uncharacterized protein n=1 Tax=Corynebacterium breve TaxID=3049799 RepID=A0ABY8VH68_9CORY|nr:hypothetical protein [Corynebacterium breve]WIM69016.1 hypothetical protein QP027_04565 [Corynebacterium breve]